MTDLEWDRLGLYPRDYLPPLPRLHRGMSQADRAQHRRHAPLLRWARRQVQKRMKEDKNMNRLKLLLILATMPEEPFGWVLLALANRIFPDGLGGFQSDSRTSIEAAITEAQILTGYTDPLGPRLHRDPPKLNKPRLPRVISVGGRPPGTKRNS